MVAAILGRIEEHELDLFGRATRRNPNCAHLGACQNTSPRTALVPRAYASDVQWFLEVGHQHRTVLWIVPLAEATAAASHSLQGARPAQLPARGSVAEEPSAWQGPNPWTAVPLVGRARTASGREAAV